MPVILATLAMCLAVATQRSFVDTAPLSEGITDNQKSSQDSSVQELENLKHAVGKSLAIMKSQSSVYTNINGQQRGHTERLGKVDEDGRIVAQVGQQVDFDPKDAEGKSSAKIKTQVDIPDKGIHKNIEQQLPGEYEAFTGNVNRRTVDAASGTETAGNTVNAYNSVSGIQYSPLDMAEYVFWTGDEKGVTLAIEEFLQEGLMSREEAIAFLQEIKYSLDYLKNHYTQLGLNSRTKENLYQSPDYTRKNMAPAESKPELRSSFGINQLRQEANKKRSPELNTLSSSATQAIGNGAIKSSDEDYDELLEKLRMADFLYTEYSLEEVIYQLAKVMFTQSLTRDSTEAQQALQKFTNFLELEAEQGRISRALEKKVLDVLIASLSDTLTEHPELLAAARDSIGPASTNADGQKFLKQILEVNPEDKSVRTAFSPYSANGRNNKNNGMEQQQQEIIRGMKIVNTVPLGLGKYKNP